MEYSESLKKIVEMEMRNLIKMIENNDEPFNFEYINNYLMKYFDILSKNENR